MVTAQNLPQQFAQGRLYQNWDHLIITHVIFTAPIPLTSFALEIERLAVITIVRRDNVMERAYRTIIRSAIIGARGCIACSAPYFSDFLSLSVAFSNCTLIFVLPVLCYARLQGWRHLRWYELAWCALIVAISIVSVITGSIDALKALRVTLRIRINKMTLASFFNKTKLECACSRV